MAAAVQLLFQRVGGLGIGRVLLAGGDQGGDSLFKARVLTDGKACLTDKGAALIDLSADAEQRLAAALSGKTGKLVAGSGVNRFEITQGGGLAFCLPEKGQFIAPNAAVQTAGHGRAAPRGVSVFIRDKADPIPLTAIDAVQHGKKEGTPSGFPGFVGGLQNVQTVG